MSWWGRGLVPHVHVVHNIINHINNYFLLFIYSMPLILPYRRSAGRNIFRPKRRTTANKRAGLRRSMTSATRKLNQITPYKFTRYSAPLQMIMSNTAVQSIGWNQQFKLTDVVNYTDFTTLFDSYKIEKVDFYMQLLTNPEGFTEVNPGQTNLANEAWYPIMWYVLDDDDSVNPTLAQLREKQGVRRKVLRPNKIIKFTVYPKFQKVVYATATTTGYGPAKGWLDCADAGVPHYGIKGCVDFHQNLSNTQYNIEVTAKYHLTFKGPQ